MRWLRLSIDKACFWLASVLLLVVWIGGIPVSAAQTPSYRNGQMDSGIVFKLNAVKQGKPVPQAPGIVGLDLLIFPSDYPLVQGTFPNTSADLQGVLPGDRIVEINQHSTLGKSRSQVDDMISDKIGDKVHLVLSRNQRLKSVTLTVSPALDTNW